MTEINTASMAMRQSMDSMNRQQEVVDRLSKQLATGDKLTDDQVEFYVLGYNDYQEDILRTENNGRGLLTAALGVTTGAVTRMADRAEDIQMKCIALNNPVLSAEQKQLYSSGIMAALTAMQGDLESAAFNGVDLLDGKFSGQSGILQKNGVLNFATGEQLTEGSAVNFVVTGSGANGSLKSSSDDSSSNTAPTAINSDSFTFVVNGVNIVINQLSAYGAATTEQLTSYTPTVSNGVLTLTLSLGSRNQFDASMVGNILVSILQNPSKPYITGLVSADTQPASISTASVITSSPTAVQTLSQFAKKIEAYNNQGSVTIRSTVPTEQIVVQSTLTPSGGPSANPTQYLLSTWSDANRGVSVNNVQLTGGPRIPVDGVTSLVAGITYGAQATATLDLSSIAEGTVLSIMGVDYTLTAKPQQGDPAITKEIQLVQIASAIPGNPPTIDQAASTLNILKALRSDASFNRLLFTASGTTGITIQTVDNTVAFNGGTFTLTAAATNTPLATTSFITPASGSSQISSPGQANNFDFSAAAQEVIDLSDVEATYAGSNQVVLRIGNFYSQQFSTQPTASNTKLTLTNPETGASIVIPLNAQPTSGTTGYNAATAVSDQHTATQYAIAMKVALSGIQLLQNKEVTLQGQTGQEEYMGKGARVMLASTKTNLQSMKLNDVIVERNGITLDTNVGQFSMLQLTSNTVGSTTLGAFTPIVFTSSDGITQLTVTFSDNVDLTDAGVRSKLRNELLIAIGQNVGGFTLGKDSLNLPNLTFANLGINVDDVLNKLNSGLYNEVAAQFANVRTELVDARMGLANTRAWLEAVIDISDRSIEALQDSGAMLRDVDVLATAQDLRANVDMIRRISGVIGAQNAVADEQSESVQSTLRV